MKTWTIRTRLFASLGAASLVVLNASAQTPAPASATSASAATDIAPVKLPYGVEDVLKLTRAQVSEDVTLNFIHNSGTIYNLSPNDIVYLRNQGVSDRVVNTMLDQRRNVPAETAAQTPPPPAPAATSPAPVYSDANAAAAAQASPQYAPTYAQPAPVYVQPEPTYTPASTLYVIPYSSSSYYYPSYSPYWGAIPAIGALHSASVTDTAAVGITAGITAATMADITADIVAGITAVIPVAGITVTTGTADRAVIWR